MGKKEDRQKVFDKYGGKCAYCGCELKKGWHVDHVEPVGRKRKFVKGYYIEIATGKQMTTREINALPESTPFTELFRWVHDKWVVDGFERPENDSMPNFMPSCASCNIQKHGMDLEGFRQSIAYFIQSLNLYTNQYKFAKRYGLIEETGKPVVFYFETLKLKQ